MYEIHSMNRRIEALERSLNAALARLDQIELHLRDDDAKIEILTAEVHHEHNLINRLEQKTSKSPPLPVGL